MSGWVKMIDRPPKPEDCDQWGCVLAWHIHNGVVVINIHNIKNYGLYITHWMPMPAAP